MRRALHGSVPLHQNAEKEIPESQPTSPVSLELRLNAPLDGRRPVPDHGTVAELIYIYIYVYIYIIWTNGAALAA